MNKSALYLPLYSLISTPPIGRVTIKEHEKEIRTKQSQKVTLNPYQMKLSNDKIYYRNTAEWIQILSFASKKGRNREPEGEHRFWNAQRIRITSPFPPRYNLPNVVCLKTTKVKLIWCWSVFMLDHIFVDAHRKLIFFRPFYIP